MAKRLYTVVSKDDPTKTVTCDWQNASELVFHGHWTWPNPKVAAAAHRAATAEAMKLPPPQGFHADSELAAIEDDYDSDDGLIEPEPDPEPEYVAPPVVPTAVANPEPLALDGMSNRELWDTAINRGVKVDRRWGRARLMTEIEAAS